MYRECRFPDKQEGKFNIINVPRDIAVTILRKILRDVFKNKYLAFMPHPLREAWITRALERYTVHQDNVLYSQEFIAVEFANKVMRKMERVYSSSKACDKTSSFEGLRNAMRAAITQLIDAKVIPEHIDQKMAKKVIAESAKTNGDEASIVKKLEILFSFKAHQSNCRKKEKSKGATVTNIEMAKGPFGRKWPE